MRDARKWRSELSVHQIGSGEEIAAAIDMAHASGATALNVLASPILYLGRRLIMDRVATMRMPTIYQWPEQAEEDDRPAGPFSIAQRRTFPVDVHETCGERIARRRRRN
jgi:hypothetical protein